MRLLIDMNLSPKWADFLSSDGHAAAHWSKLGPAHAADTELMQYATIHGYFILTHDLDFGAILAATHGQGPSVVQIRADDLSPETIGPRRAATSGRRFDCWRAGDGRSAPREDNAVTDQDK